MFCAGTVTDTLVSVAFHPSVLKQYGINSCLSEERNMLINLAINYVCDNHKIMLSRNFIVMDENRKHWGSLQMAQKQLGSKEDDSFGKELNELEQSFGPMASGCSDSLMDQLSNISLGTSDKINTHGHNSSTTSNGTPHLNLSQTNPKKGLIEDLNPCSSLPEPLCELVSKQSSADQRLLVLKVHLEGVQSVQQCQLDISQVSCASCNNIYLFDRGVSHLNTIIIFIFETYLIFLFYTGQYTDICMYAT